MTGHRLGNKKPHELTEPVRVYKFKFKGATGRVTTPPRSQSRTVFLYIDRDCKIVIVRS